MRNIYITVTIVIFVLLSICLYLIYAYNPAYSFRAMEGANALMAALVLGAYFIVSKDVASRPQAFVRGIYSASLLKLMVCMIAVLAYIALNRHSLNKYVIFIMLGIYAVFTAAETILLQKMARKKQA